MLNLNLNLNVFVAIFSVDNGFNPVWNEACEFDILNPEVALMRFIVQDEDVFGEPNFLGQATIPVKSIRTGMAFIVFPWYSTCKMVVVVVVVVKIFRNY